MRVVLDTNTLASAAIAIPGGTIFRISEAGRTGVYDLYVSEYILDELASTLAAPFFGRRLTSDESTGYVNVLRGLARAVPITADVHGVATHTEDDLILATAVSANADYLVTGDLKLQALSAYQGVTITSPRTFLAILGEHGYRP